MKPHPIEVRNQAERLRERGLTDKAISRKLGVSHASVRRWLNPEHHERQKQQSRAYKSRHRKQCPVCGKPIWLTSETCPECVPTRLQPKWTKEKVIAAAHEWADLHNGEPPKAMEWRKRGDYHPNFGSVYGRPNAPFKSWNEFIEAAGFTPRPSNPGPGRSKWDKEEGQRLRAQGMSDIEIGRLFGVTSKAIWNRLGRRDTPSRNTRPRAPRGRTREQRIADLRKALQHQ